MNSELKLVERTRKGDVNAFKEIVEQNKKRVYHLAYDITGNREDAEDVSQEVFIKAYKSIKDFRGEAKLSTWLHQITVNTCNTLTRKKSYTALKPEENMNEVLENNEMFNESPYDNPEAFAEAGFIELSMGAALDKLSTREKSVFVLRNYSKLNFNEISEILEIQASTIRTLNFRAIQKLRKELHYYKNDYSEGK